MNVEQNKNKKKGEKKKIYKIVIEKRAALRNTLCARDIKRN